MQKILLLTGMILMLNGCVHKMNIEQGNILTPALTSQIHTGMSRDEVKNVLGSPLLLNTLNDNRVDYIYTYKPGRGTMSEKTLILHFSNNKVTEISGTMAH